MNAHRSCVVCGSPALIPLRKFSRAHLVRCKGCGMVFSRLIPSADELASNYRSYPKAAFISPVTVKRYHALLDELEPFRVRNRLLDIGCGSGDFLAVARVRGWDVFGTEFNEDYAALCGTKGIAMKKGAENDFAGDFFDVITAIEVIEHFPDPSVEIRKAGKWLREGGLFYFTTPNFSSLGKALSGGAWNVVDYPEHLAYFTPKTANRLLVDAGFKKLKLRTTGISVTRIRTSRKMSAQAFVSAGSDDERLRSAIEKRKWLQALKAVVNAFLSLTRKGDSLKGYYQKVR